MLSLDVLSVIPVVSWCYSSVSPSCHTKCFISRSDLSDVVKQCQLHQLRCINGCIYALQKVLVTGLKSLYRSVLI